MEELENPTYICTTSVPSRFPMFVMVASALIEFPLVEKTISSSLNSV